MKSTCSFPPLVFLLLPPSHLVPFSSPAFVLPPFLLLVLSFLARDSRRFLPLRLGDDRGSNFLRLRRLGFPCSSDLRRSSVSLRQPRAQQLPERLRARLVCLNWRMGAEINMIGSVRLGIFCRVVTETRRGNGVSLFYEWS